MDFLIEIAIEIVGGIIEVFFGEVPLKKLPRPLRFSILFVFWFGLSALFFWLTSLAFAKARVLSVIFFVAAVAFIFLGVHYISKSMREKYKKEEQESAEKEKNGLSETASE